MLRAVADVSHLKRSHWAGEGSIVCQSFSAMVSRCRFWGSSPHDGFIHGFDGDGEGMCCLGEKLKGCRVVFSKSLGVTKDNDPLLQ